MKQPRAAPPDELQGLLAKSLRLDPYLLWGVLTGFRDYRQGAGPLVLSVAVELMVDGEEPTIEPDAVLFSKLNPGNGRFRTYHVTRSGLFHLLHCPEVRRLELGTAVAPVEGKFRLVPQAINKSVAVAVVDDFIAFQHECFLEAMETRFASIWSQDRRRPDSADPEEWQPKVGLPYGYEWPPDRRASTDVEQADVRPAAYPRVLPRRSHGTMVAYLAAGNGHETSDASTAALIGVHLPRSTVNDTSGGALNVQALDALFYVLAACGANTRVVLNLSYATMAGPHDGTSILEAALDERVKLLQGKLAVVLPAGNAYSRKAHAAFTLDGDEPVATLHWFVPPSLRRPSFLEIWLPKAGLGFDMELESPDGSVRLETSGEPQIDWVGNPVIGAIIRLSQVANGDNGTMVLVALASTAAIDGHGAVCQAGVWTVKFRLTNREHVIPVRAWIERGDSLPDFPNLGTQSYFVDPAYEDEGRTPKEPDDSCSVVQRRGSFNTVACGKNTIVAGGYRGLHAPQVRQYAEGTGSGPLRFTLREGPDFNACTEESAAVPSLRVAGNQPGDVVRGSGTSMAAPQLTRLIAELLTYRPMEPEVLRAALEMMVVDNEPPAPRDYPREGRGRLPSVLDSGPATFSKPYP